MTKDNAKYSAYISILKEELVPAMGCTEPIALAYCAAKAREVLGEMPDRVVIGASGSIIKNVKSVIVPNTDHMKGIPAAAVAGIVGGDASRELEVIAQVSQEQIAAMRPYLANTPITVEHVDNGLTFEIIVTVFKGANYAKVRIVNYHTNIVLIEKNGEVLMEVHVDGEGESGLTDRSILNLADILDFALFAAADGNRHEFPLSLGHCLGKGSALGADGGGKRGVFNVAALVYRPVGAQQCRPHKVAGVGGISPPHGIYGIVDQNFRFHSFLLTVIPFSGISLDILPTIQIVSFTAYHMIIKTLLPYGESDLLCHISF